MTKKTLLLLGLSIVLLGALVGCGGSSGGGAPSGEIALEVTGNVENQLGWAEDEVRSMDTTEAERENKEGEMSTYTGVPSRPCWRRRASRTTLPRSPSSPRTITPPTPSWPR